MTRREEIEKAATDYINSDAVSPMNMQLAFGDFINGAEWADKTMIEKALDWLKDMTLDYIQGDVRDFDFYSFEKDFRKAMEE